VADIDGCTLEIYSANNIEVATVTVSGISVITLNDSSNPLTVDGTNNFTVYNITNGTTCLINSISITTVITPGGQDEIATGVSINPITVSPANKIAYNFNPWTVAEIAGDVFEWRYDKVTGNLVDLSITGTEVYPGTVSLLTGWSNPSANVYVHTGVSGELRFLVNDGTLIENDLYRISGSKASSATLQIQLGGPATTDNTVTFSASGAFSFDIPAEGLGSVDALRFSSAAEETLTNLSIKPAGQPLESQVITLVNCLDSDIPNGAIIDPSTGFFIIDPATGFFIVDPAA